MSADPDTSFTVSYSCRLSTAVVLAAGNSERLRAVTAGGSKLLLRIGGMPFIERTVRMATHVGRGEVVVVTRHDAERIAHTAEQAGFGRVVVVRAPDWELGNSCSLAAAAAVVGEEPMFLLLMGDQVLDEAALRALLAGAVRRRWSTPARTPQSLAKVPGLSSRSAGSSPSARVGSRAQWTAARSARRLVCLPVRSRQPLRATTGWQVR